jgi:hypothetical protein
LGKVEIWHLSEASLAPVNCPRRVILTWSHEPELLALHLAIALLCWVTIIKEMK